MKHITFIISLALITSSLELRAEGEECDQFVAVDQQFFTDVDAVKKYTDGMCHDDGEPTRNAYNYMLKLKLFTEDAKDRLNDLDKQFIDSKQTEALIDVNAKIKAPPTKDYKEDLLDLLSLLPGGGPLKVAVKSLDNGVKAYKKAEASLKKANNVLHAIEDKRPGTSKDPVSDELTTMKEQFSNMKAVKAKLVDQLEAVKNRLDSILTRVGTDHSKLDKLEEFDMEGPEGELARSILCSFKRPIKRYNFSQKMADDVAQCKTTIDGTEVDYNKLRGNLSCKDDEALSEANRHKEFRRLNALYAMDLAKKVRTPDRYGIHPEGTLPRFEIEAVVDSTNEYHGLKKGSESPVRSMKIKFRSPGGAELLCALAKHPKYDKHWKKEGDRKVLQPTLKIHELGLPVAMRVTKTHQYTATTWKTHGDIYYQQESDGSLSTKPVAKSESKLWSGDFEKKGVEKYVQENKHIWSDVPVSKALESCVFES